MLPTEPQVGKMVAAGLTSIRADPSPRERAAWLRSGPFESGFIRPLPGWLTAP